MYLSIEEELLLTAVKLHPSMEEMDALNDLLTQVEDWNSVVDLLIAHGSAPLFFKKLPDLANSNVVPVEISAKLQQVYFKTLSRSTLLYESFRQIMEAFAKANIVPIALKGVYLSEWLYKDIALRQFSDLDLLFRPEEASRCLQILVGMGFKSESSGVSKFIEKHSEIIHYAPMRRNGVSVEVHIRLNGTNEHSNLKLDRFIQQAEPIILNKVAAKALSLYHLFIHLCVHLDKHFVGGQVQMKCFNDIVNLLDKTKETLDWNAFLEECRYHKCEKLVIKYLIMAHYFYNVSLPEFILKEHEHLLTEADKDQFMIYLHLQHKGIRRYHVATHLKNLNTLLSPKDKVRYALEFTFPSKTFMLLRYEIKQRHLFALWYPYRWWFGAMGFAKLMQDKLKKASHKR
jgi:hypothetical protein